jgi:hypothetical protein
VEVKNTRNIKKSLLLVIALAITMGLVISSVGSIQVSEKTEQTNSINIVASNKVAQTLSVPIQTLNKPLIKVEGTISRGEVAFGEVGNQLHPAFDRAGATQMAAYKDEDFQNIVWTFTATDGPPYDAGVYYDNNGDYPSIKLWEGTTFYGTFVTDYLDLNGGPTYLFKTTDPTDNTNYEMTYFDWSQHGWSDMIDADIACDSSQEPFEWGVSSYVTSTTYGSTYTDGPTIVYSDEVTQGSGWISWYYYDGCDHTDIDIDRSTIYSYAVYDWEDTTAGNFKLLVRVNDFAEIMEGFDQIYEIDDGSNLQFPAVAAGDGNIVILAETDVAGNKDIICYYGTSVEALTTSFVADSGADERFPDVRHVSGLKFIATYVMDGNLYATETTDGGATWATPWQVNDNTGCVVEEYKTSDLAGAGAKAMWEEDCGDDIDIYIGGVIDNDPPGAPTITGQNGGKPGKQYTFSFNAVDPEGENVKYHINWGDGTSETTSFAASGTDVDVSHSWENEGTYTITASAEDINGLVGPEATKQMNVPRGKALNFPFYSFLQSHPNMFPLLRALLGL